MSTIAIGIEEESQFTARALDKRELRQAQSDTEHPLGPWLREQYV